MSTENNNIDKVTTLNAAFADSGLTFTDTAAALEQFQKQHGEVIFAEDGSAYSHIEGIRRPLHLCLSEFGLANPSQIDRRSLIRARSKSELKTFSEKSAYLKQHGLEAFEKLPLTHTDQKDVVTQSDWRKLTVSQKVAAIQADPDVQRKLKPDTTHSATFINHELIAKQNSIRPGSKR